MNGAAHPIFMLNRHSALWTAAKVPSRCSREITTAPERLELLFLIKQLSSQLFHSIIWRLPPPTGQAEPAIGVATVEGDRGDEEVKAGGALVLRLKGLCQLAWAQHYIRKRLKRKSHRGALFSLPPSQTQTCKPAVLLIATAEPPA